MLDFAWHTQTPQEAGMVQTYLCTLHSGSREAQKSTVILVSMRPCPKKEKAFPGFVSSLLILPFLAKEHVPTYRLFKKYIFLTVILCVLLGFAGLYVCALLIYLVPSEARSKCQIPLELGFCYRQLWAAGNPTWALWKYIQCLPHPSFFKTRQNLTVDQTNLKPRSSTTAK